VPWRSRPFIGPILKGSKGSRLCENATFVYRRLNIEAYGRAERRKTRKIPVRSTMRTIASSFHTASVDSGRRRSLKSPRNSGERRFVKILEFCTERYKSDEQVGAASNDPQTRRGDGVAYDGTHRPPRQKGAGRRYWTLHLLRSAWLRREADEGTHNPIFVRL